MNNVAEQEKMSDIWRGTTTNNADATSKNGGVPRVDTEGSEAMPRVTVASARSSQASQPNILRTVYLPNEQVGQLKTSNEHLDR